MKPLIEENRAAFDHLEPRPDTRSRVLAAVTKRPIIPIVLWKAAAVIFFVSTVYLGLERTGAFPEENKAEVSGFRQVESFYKSELSRRVSWLEESGSNEPVSQELVELESMYEVLYEQWTLSPTKRIEDAMTLNLIVRVKKMDDMVAAVRWQ